LPSIVGGVRKRGTWRVRAFSRGSTTVEFAFSFDAAATEVTGEADCAQTQNAYGSIRINDVVATINLEVRATFISTQTLLVTALLLFLG
jgi:hypothetical protein